MLSELHEGVVVEMRRTHPCGGRLWQVERVGADIGMQCRTCGRRVLMDRAQFERRARRILERDR